MSNEAQRQSAELTDSAATASLQDLVKSENLEDLGVQKAGSKILFRAMFDTEVLFAAGDLAAAWLTTEFFGIFINTAAALLAIGGRIYETVTGAKPLGLGFYAMAGVSALTTVSIVVNGIQIYGLALFDFTSHGSQQLLFGAAAFGTWTLANLVAGFRRSHASIKPKTVLGNHQIWFCLGSILATHARSLPGLLFLIGLIKAVLRQSNDSGQEIKTWSQLLNRHLTPARLRGAAYAISTGMAAFGDPSYALPYGLWMVGNFAFDNAGLNRTIGRDLATVFRRKSGGND